MSHRSDVDCCSAVCNPETIGNPTMTIASLVAAGAVVRLGASVTMEGRIA